MNLLPIDNHLHWNKLLEQCGETDLHQTWGYGDAIRSCTSWQVERYAVLDKDQPLAMAQVFTQDLPMIGPMARMQNGPMFIQCDANESPEYRMNILRFLKQEWIETRKTALHLSPCLYEKDLPGDWINLIGLQASDEPVWASIRLDLQQTPETLRSRMRRTGWREPLRKAGQAGLGAIWSREERDFAFLLERYKEAQKGKRFSWPSPDVVRALWNANRDAFHLVFIDREGERVSGMAVYTFADIAFCLIAWNHPDSRELHAANFIFWQSILYFHERPFRWLDLGGIDPVNLPGITAFKRGMHGEEYRLAGRAVGTPDENVSLDRMEGDASVFTGISSEISDDSSVADRVADTVTQFVRRLYGSDFPLTPSQSLIDSGTIDSLSIVSLVQALQDGYDIEIAPYELTVENFDSIERIQAFIQSKRRM